MVQNRLETVVILALIALIASKFPKMVKGIVKSVNIGISMETKKEMIASTVVSTASKKYKLLNWNIVPIPDVVKVIMAAERNKFLKCLVL